MRGSKDKDKGREIMKNIHSLICFQTGIME